MVVVIWGEVQYPKMAKVFQGRGGVKGGVYGCGKPRPVFFFLFFLVSLFVFLVLSLILIYHFLFFFEV